MEQERTETWSITADQQKRIEEVCFRSLALIGRNCEYLEQHFGSTGADEPARQAVVDINAAAAQLDRTISEAMTLLEFLRADKKPQLYPMDLCELLQQVAAQADMIRAQLGVDIRLDYGSYTTCCVMADRSDAELLCLHLLSNALRASREGGSVDITLCRTESDWKLTFADAGCGLPGEDAQAALENRRSFLGGAQLGLVLCQECCRRMDWSLQLESAPPKRNEGCGKYSAAHRRRPPRQHSGAACRHGDRAGTAAVLSACHAGAGDAHHAGARRPGRAAALISEDVRELLHSVLCGSFFAYKTATCSQKIQLSE